MFPARAGMSLMESLGFLLIVYVPRASGDEPKIAVIWLLSTVCSPRERG